MWLYVCISVCVCVSVCGTHASACATTACVYNSVQMHSVLDSSVCVLEYCMCMCVEGTLLEYDVFTSPSICL